MKVNEPLISRPEREQTIHGVPRHYWLPLLAFLGGSLIFIIVDVICYLVSGHLPHAPGSISVRDVPR